MIRIAMADDDEVFLKKIEKIEKKVLPNRKVCAIL